MLCGQPVDSFHFLIVAQATSVRDSVEDCQLPHIVGRVPTVKADGTRV